MQRSSQVGFKTHFLALDGYRAIAVLLVFCGHYGGGLHQGPKLRALYYFTAMGPAGVGLFFVLSGFLITGILYDTVALFPPNARWEATLPAPSYLDGGISEVLAAL